MILVKEWYLLIENKKEGPYSIDDLRLDRRITPDTLVWKEGFKEWTPIRHVQELEKLFKDEKKSDDEEEKKDFQLKALEADREVIAVPYDPFFSWGALIILIAIMIYLFYWLQ